MPDNDTRVQPADDATWAEFDRLASRSYGHPVTDVIALRDRGDARVAVRAGKVIAGGIGLLARQHFGGRPVTSALLAAGCVAPEERGDRLAAYVVAERVAALRERGAVISTVWTKAAGYARRQGWESVTPVHAWSVNADELARSFADCRRLVVEHGLHDHVPTVHARLATAWDGPVARPDWWWHWLHNKHDLTDYTTLGVDGSPQGWVSLSTRRHDHHGTVVRVHDFWAADHAAAETLYSFLGRYRSRATRIDFRRGVLGPDPLLLQRLNRHRVTTEAWHPWMLRILDLPAAIAQRGWAPELDATLVVQVDGEVCRVALHWRDGIAYAAATDAPAQVTLTGRHLSAWYAGAYRSPASARLAGITATDDTSLAIFIHATGPGEPWLPDHF